MKNASFIFLCCISSIIITPIIMYLYHNNIPENHITKNTSIKVLNTNDDSILIMDLEEYIWRVVAKELPSSFEDEAIKAQAIAARTYALRKIGKPIDKHKNADVCTDFNHCAAFLLPGDEPNITNKACLRYKQLSLETKGQILTYNNEPILAVFHAISSGVTEKSSDVWNSQLPYLVNVDSSVDAAVEGYTSEVTFSIEELKELFNFSKSDSIKIISRTEGGSIKEIEIFGNIYSGSEVRSKLNLRSSNFTVSKEGNNYTFNVIGYGHGVGMSQHGANEYAKTGMTYEEILSKYYPGTMITTLQ